MVSVLLIPKLNKDGTKNLSIFSLMSTFAHIPNKIISNQNNALEKNHYWLGFITQGWFNIRKYISVIEHINKFREKSIIISIVTEILLQSSVLQYLWFFYLRKLDKQYVPRTYKKCKCDALLVRQKNLRFLTIIAIWSWRPLYAMWRNLNLCRRSRILSKRMT